MVKLATIQPQTFFLIAALLWGGLNVFLIPPFQIPDEPAHYYKTWHLAQGKLFPHAIYNDVGGYVPKSAETLQLSLDSFIHRTDIKLSMHRLGQAAQIEIKDGEVVFKSFHNTARLFPVPYIPQTMGLLFSKPLTKSPLIRLYSGRIFNLAVWIIMIFWAIKIMPIQAWTMTMLALLPMHITLAASLSADTFTNAISFLTIAGILKMMLSMKKVQIKHAVYIAVALFLTALSKNIYVLIGLLYLLIPIHLFENRKVYFTSLFIVEVGTFAGIVLGSYYTNWVYGLVDPDVPFFYTLSEKLHQVDHHKQLSLILKNPLLFLKLIIMTYKEQGVVMIQSLIGVLGWFDLWLSKGYYIFMVVALPLIAVLDKNQKMSINIKIRMGSATVTFLVTIALITISYLTWTPIGSPRVEGLQGRYLIPILPIIFLPLFSQKPLIHKNWLIIICINIVLVSFFVSTFALFHRYWDI